MDMGVTLGHLAALIAEYRARALDNEQNLDTYKKYILHLEEQNEYLREIVAHYNDLAQAPEPEEISPEHGPFSIEALGMSHLAMTGPAIYEDAPEHVHVHKPGHGHESAKT